MYLCPSRPVLCAATTLLNLMSNFAAALPCISRTFTTIYINARRMALMSVIMMPKSIACISSRISIWCTQKLEISQNALKTRCAPHPFQTSS